MMIKSAGLLLAASFYTTSPTVAFQLPSIGLTSNRTARNAKIMTALSSSTTANNDGASSIKTSANENTSKSYLYVPSERDEHYKGNVAQYLLDLNDEGSTFDFCGGMMFQLVLSDKLKSHLQTVATTSSNDNEPQQQPTIHPSSQQLMNRIPNYSKSSYADNISIFHGRELRNIPKANGGMNFVLQLSYADDDNSIIVDESLAKDAGKGADGLWNGKAVDPQGWSSEEITTYDGWRSDSFRKWRNRPLYESEGYTTFTNEFGTDGYGLNHRFYLHYDNENRMWLSAEDGCEGTPSEGRSLIGKLGGILFGK